MIPDESQPFGPSLISLDLFARLGGAKKLPVKRVKEGRASRARGWHSKTPVWSRLLVAVPLETVDLRPSGPSELRMHPLASGGWSVGWVLRH